MKKSILNSLLALGLLLICTTINASLNLNKSSFDNIRDSISIGVNQIIKIRANQVTHQMEGIGFETHFGETYSLSDVLFINPNSRSALSKILRKDIIELKSGEILYREEISFGLVKLNRSFETGFNFDPLQKAPHTPD